jgi:GT2 family glycosyltransferase
MRVGRSIGAAVRRIPGVGGAVERVRFALRAIRRARWDRRGGGPERRYAEWVRAVDTPSPAELAELHSRGETLPTGPIFSLLVMPEAADPALLERAILSIRRQAYPRWEACVAISGVDAIVAATVLRHTAAEPRVRPVHTDLASSAAALRNAAFAATGGDFVAIVGGADVLPPQALLHIAEAIMADPQVGLVYADEDRLHATGRRHDPWFKCDYNRELLLAHDAVARPAFYSRTLVAGLGGWREGFAGAEDHDLALRAVAAAGARRVIHVPRILLHRGGPREEDAAESGRRAVRDLLNRLGSDALVEAAPEATQCHRVRHPLPAVAPLVSIIVCTRDQERLLRVAVESITSCTTYPRYEIVIVDNGSINPAAVALLTRLAVRPDIRVLRDDGPFNYARLNNRAAAAARGEVLCLLNDDVEVLTSGWLEEMVSFALQPDVGAVGARLWYPDDTLQHGGVVIGIGRDAGHAHPRIGRGDPGYHGRAVLHQEWSAVTAACLVVRAELYAAVSGLDERLGVAFNDVDFCLRLRQAGYRTVWTPYAELVHHESASRGADDTPAKRARATREVALLHDRWGPALQHDPFYNPNLSRVAADFSIDPPRRHFAS